MVLIAFALVHAADSSTRIQEWLQNNQPDRAQEHCGGLGKKSPITDASLRELCAQAELENLIRQADPAPPPRERLDTLSQSWPGTKAAAQASEMASRRALVQARQDPVAIRAVIAAYPKTTTVSEAVRRLWGVTPQNDLAAIESFQKEFPASPEADQARILLQELRWSAALHQNTVSGWREFQAKYPDHPRLPEASAREMALAFQEARSQNTAVAWESLLQIYPNHPRKAEAESLYQALLPPPTGAVIVIALQ